MGDLVFGKFSVAVVTPFKNSQEDPNQAIDLVALEAVITHVAGGLQKVRSEISLVGGIIVSGTTGEQHSMNLDEKVDLYAHAVQISKRFDIPVVAGVSHTTIPGVQRLTRAALSAGCEGIMLGLPPYLKLCDDEIRGYIQAVKSLLPEHFPLLLYNNVMRNCYGPSVPLLAELCNDNTIWGIKHAPPPGEFLPQAEAILQHAPQARLYTGSDKMFPELAHSVTTPFYGLTSIIGNVYPAHTANLVCDITSTDPALRAQGLQAHAQLVPVIDSVLLGTTLPTGLKHAIRCKGVQAGYPRQPIGHMSEEKKQEIDQVVQSVV